MVYICDTLGPGAMLTLMPPAATVEPVEWWLNLFADGTVVQRVTADGKGGYRVCPNAENHAKEIEHV